MVLTKEPAEYSLLIADDDVQSRAALRDIVEHEGYRTVLAESGEEALDILHHRPVHLFVCDMYMPKLTGVETLQLVRQLNRLLPCILVSGDVNEQLMQQALHVKAYSVLAKPVSKHLLLYSVVRALAKAYETER